VGVGVSPQVGVFGSWARGADKPSYNSPRDYGPRDRCAVGRAVPARCQLQPRLAPSPFLVANAPAVWNRSAPG